MLDDSDPGVPNGWNYKHNLDAPPPIPYKR